MPADAIARRFASGVPDDKAHAIEALEPRLLLSGGQFDPTFGDHGAAHGELFPGGGADAVAIQTDGKIVAGGSTVVGTNTVFALARYQANGSLDRAFGTAGRVTLSFGGNRAAVTGVAVQRDGKIVVAGYTEAWADPFSFPTASRFALARFLPGGAPDRTFGTGGMVTVSFLGFDQADAVALEPDGSIVVAGSAQTANAQTSEFALARLTNRGALDASFGSHGKVLTSFAGSIAATGLLVQRDGKIVASGHMQWGPLLPSGAQIGRYAIARFLASVTR